MGEAVVEEILEGEAQARDQAKRVCRPNGQRGEEPLDPGKGAAG